MGGLGIGSLLAFNYALLQKWRWMFVREANTYWVRLIKAIYGDKGVGSVNIGSFTNGVWEKIVGSIRKLHENGVIPFTTLEKRLGRGNSICLWTEVWVGNQTFA